MKRKYEGFNKSGTFTLANGTQVSGELRLDGAATAVTLHSRDFFIPESSDGILGHLFDLDKVSLLGCVTPSVAGTGTRGTERYHFANVFPHFVVFGDRHLRSSEREIQSVSFTVDDAARVFYDFEAFGSVIDARPHMERIAAEKSGAPTTLGEHPLLFYFTGKHEIFTAKTTVGNVSAAHALSYGLPGPEGINVQNTIGLLIDFDSPRVFDEALLAITDVLRFVEVIAGRPQNLSRLAIRTEAVHEDASGWLDVYWSMPPRREREDESRVPHPADVLIQAPRDPAKFAIVLQRWIERNEQWRHSRMRFADAFGHQNRYSIDRMVGAANMFDILPTTAHPPDVSLAPEIYEARDAARRMFSDLQPSPERDSVLGALGRIDKPTLKRKARARANIVTAAAPALFSELDLVVDQAVNCRNFYVHGSISAIDYGVNFDQVQFFTDTLEFVFGVSDLLECGWSISDWRDTSMSHPFGLYLITYSERLGRLRLLLAQTKVTPTLPS